MTLQLKISSFFLINKLSNEKNIKCDMCYNKNFEKVKKKIVRYSFYIIVIDIKKLENF